MNAPQQNPAAPPANNGRRKRIVGGIVAVFALAGIVYGIYWVLVARFQESTDDAYVNADLVQVTPQTNGTVVAVGVDDTNYVQAGHLLVQLDPADTKVALDQAEAELAKTVREVRNLFAVAAQQKATVDMRRSELKRTEDDFARRKRLASSGAVSSEDVRHAQEAVTSADAALRAAEHQAVATNALVDGTDVAHHPDVLAASAKLRDAFLNNSRTVIPAPVSGFVARRNVQLGQRVSPGTPLMAVVPLDQVWVDANFKEGQLADVRVGQPAEVTADLYGSSVTYHGKVEGFGAGTGGAFALLPAQNATGNWVKVVQRLPVRIALDAKEVAAHPLQVGLSTTVVIDIHDQGEKGQSRLPLQPRSTPADTTDVFKTADAEASKRTAAIIAANIGSQP